MIEFITQYWSFISFGILFLCELILFFIKKRPQVIDNSFFVKLSDWILKAESIYKSGEDKMSFVLCMAKEYLGNKFVEKDVRAMVESILTIPQKKEK